MSPVFIYIITPDAH